MKTLFTFSFLKKSSTEITLLKSRKLCAALAVLFVVGVGNVWGETIYSNAGATGTTSGITASGYTNGNNGNPSPSFANTSSSNRTFLTITGLSVSSYTNVQLTFDFRLAKNSGQYSSFTVSQYNSSDVLIGSATNVTGTNNTTFVSKTINIASNCVKLVFYGSPISGTYGNYVDNISITGTAAAASHTLGYEVSPAASGTVDLSATTIAEGSTATATATPNSGYRFSSWAISGAGAILSSTSTNPTTVTMGTANATVTANFVSKGCTDHYGDNVASGTETSNKYGPVATYYNYSTRQILYTRADLNLAAGKKGTIKSIYFNASTAITARKIKIYMANTFLDALSANDYVPYADFTQVFASNSWTCSSGWNEIELTTPFEYSGRGNLVVLIDDNTGEYHASEYFRYHTATTTTGAQIWKGSDSDNEVPSSTDWTSYTPINYRPRTKFCIQEADMKLAKVTLMDNSATLTEESLSAGVTLPSRAGCTGYTFAGWTKSWTSAQSSGTTTAPTIIPAGSYIPSAEDENLYPVYTTTGEGTADVTIIPDTYTNKRTSAYDSGAERTGTVGTINFGAHYVTGNSAGTPMSSSTGQFLQCQGNNATIYNKTAFPGKITQVVLNQNGATAFSLYCGTSQLMASNNTSTGQTPSGTAQTAQSAATKMTWTVSGNNTYFALKKGTSTGYVSSIVITYSATTTYYMSEASCCTALGSINGSVSWSNAETAVVSWDNIDHVSSWTVKYKTHAAGAYTTWAGEQRTADGRRSVTISGLTPCTDYDFQIIANPASGYCDKDQTIEDSQTHNWTVTKTGVTNVTAASLSAIPATTCASGFGPITITAADGYVLPAEITVTNATKLWNSSTGALSISSVTGNVSITITPAEESCPDQYTFAYGATPDGDGKNITDATRLCFSQVAATTEYQITGFTIPTTTQYFWVGYNGYYYDSNIGPGGASNKGSERNQFKYLHVTALQGQTCSDSRTGESLQHAQAGAYGTLRIYSNYDDKNLYVGFVPAGYQMRMGSGASWTNIQLTQDGSVWTSDLMTLDAATIAKNYYINIWTGSSYSSSDEGVAINNWTDGGSTISSMAFKTGAGDNWDTSTGLSAGMRGKFRTWTDNCANNGYCHFVPYYQLQYNPASTSGTGTGSMSPLPASPVSCEESAANRTVTVATSSFTAPQYKQFDHWNTAADNNGSNVSTGSYTLTSDVTLYAQWAYIPVTALTLNYSTLKKYVGESSVTLSVSSVTPNTANPAVTWSSSDATVASVDGGVVSFLKAGTATITATSTVSGSITATCSVEVRSISSPTMQDEDGTTISGSGLSATWTLNTRTLAASEGTSKYKFKRWIVTNATPASTTNLSTTLGDPTGNVTVVAEFYKPRTVTKGTGTGTSTFTVSPTGEVKYGSSVTVTCAATDGYKNPWTLTVTPSDGATYDETGSTGSITISNITKNITVDLAYTDKGCTTHAAASIIGNTDYSTYNYGPVNNYYKYSARQILYKRDDLNFSASTKKGTIKSISFQYAFGTAMTKKTNVKIYMANTPLDALATNSYVPFADFTEVYSGALNCSNGWNEIELTTDFEYNGVGNLAVLIDDNSNQYDGNSYVFYYHSATGAQIHGYYDSGDIDPSNVSSWNNLAAIDYRPNTKFCIEEDDMVEATVNWYVNGSVEHTQTAYEGTVLTGIPTPDSEDCDGEKEFVGWYTDDYANASVAPAFVNPKVIPEGGADYYAVFATTSPTNNYQQITSESDLVAGAKYLIVGNSSTTYNALPVDATTSLISVSPSGTPLTISNPGATLIWTLEGSADAWKIKSTSNNKYLQISSGSLTFETSTSLTFSVGVSSNIFTFTSSAASGNKILSYYHGGKPSQFNAYSSANTVYVYKQVINATNFATTCATTYDVNRAGTPAGTVTGGTFTVSPSKQAAGKTVNLSPTPDLGYSFGSWTVTKTEAPYTDITSTNVAGNTLTMPAFDVTVNATFTPTPELTATGGDLSSTTLPFGTSCEQDEGTDKTFVLNGYSLTNDVTLTISGTDASMFSVKSPSSPIDKGTGRITDQTVTVTFTPTSTGTKTATLTIASSGASSIVLTLSGTAIKHYKVHYWNSGIDVHQESVLAGTDASATWDGVGDEDGCDTETYKYFVGWSKTNVGSTPTSSKPTIGETYTSLSSDVNYYAVWTNVNPNGWERYESSTIAEGDYLIIQHYGSNDLSLSNDLVSNKLEEGVATISAGLVTQPTSASGYDWADFIWHIQESATAGYYTFYNEKADKYIVSTGTYNQVDLVTTPSDGKDLFSFSYNSTNKTYIWTNKYNTDNNVLNTSSKLSNIFRYGGASFACYATDNHFLYLYYRAGGTAQYITNCCDKNVTLATNSPSHGSITFSPEGPIATCGADAATRQTTMTVTPDAGYYLSDWSTAGVTPAGLSTDIEYGSVSNSGEQSTTVTFTQNTTTGTYTANATFSPIPVSSLTLHAIKKDNTSATIFEETGNNVALSLYPTEGKTTSSADPLGHTVKIEFGAVLPDNALNKGYTWSATVNGAAVGWSSNNLVTNAVLEFNKSTGKVVAKAAGTAEIIITADDESGVTAKVTITVANVAMNSVSVSPTEMEVYAGEKKPVTVTFTPANATDRSYSAGSSYTYVNIQNKGASSFNIEGKSSVTDANHDETVTVTTTDGSKTATIDVTVKPLPKVTFVDNLQGKTDFTNWGTDGVVSSTGTDGVVTHTKPTPSHADISDPGASYNACERNHLHLVGWIESEWADAHPNATHEQIVGANASSGAGTYLEAGADFNVETYNGNTYYAVWSKIE